MIPVPFSEKGLPDIYKGDLNPANTAFCDYMDSLINGLMTDIKGVSHFFDPFRCPTDLLSELGYFVNANLLNFNTEDQKRKKIANAIKTQKIRSTWEDDIKLKIDAYVGGNSSIFDNPFSDDFILVGDDSDLYYSTLGDDGIDDDLGMALIGSGLEIEESGNIFIDVDSNTLTTEQVEQLKQELVDSIPAYFYIHLGYTTTGVFTEYANGLIG